MKILVIEDEQELAEKMTAFLTGQGYCSETAATYQQALEKLESNPFDCILLDMTIQGDDGPKILEVIKSQNKENSVVMISTKGSRENKSINLADISEKVHTMLRRKEFGNDNIVQINGLSIDVFTRKAQIEDKEIHFTNKEIDLLLYLIGNRNRIVSKNALAEYLSGKKPESENNYDIIYAHIKNLKKKLHEAGCEKYLRTIYGSGYKWES